MSKSSATTKLTETEIIQKRLKQGQRFVNRGWSERDRLACKRFLDGSETSAYLLYDDNEDTNDGAGVIPEIQEVGNVNYLQTNIITKVSSIAVGDPDYHVYTEDPDASELVRQYLKLICKQRNWVRVFKKALTRRSISGMGCIAYLWNDAKGPVIEHVQPRDLSIDPNTTDWRDLRWGARQLRMPKEDAEARWGEKSDLFQMPPHDIPNMDDPGTVTQYSVPLWVYWDKTTEAIFYGTEELEKGPNLYKRVPLCFLEGDIAPESPFSLGDYDVATGLQEQLARLQSMINNQAESGGAIGWYNPAYLNDSSKDAFNSGRPQEFVAIDTDPDKVFGFVSGEPMSESLLEAWRLGQQGLDSVTGVTQYQRGVIANAAKFATEAAMLQNQSGSRGNQARIEFEQFLDMIAIRVCEITKWFAPSLMLDQDPADQALLDALGKVQDISVIENSTSYKDPGIEMQSSLQLMNAMGPYIERGLVNPVPLIQDVLRAFGKRDVTKYLIQSSPVQPGVGQPPPGQPAPGEAAGVGAAPAAPGPVQ